ncbi:GntR family transcriptional regulator [Lactobacillus iners]|jgi:transcriptional regulator|uniref:UbiC transcription regulator-associated domain protein n=3 Tax=Lactobacillus iners TaxID=147802 RepID=C8PDF4_9LACO|nr:GntR family transcriptional regulator [Lactobacillus iners]EFO68116.1 UbiC transcription regulator-associated domain protein [Lactobacillus iners LactinV 09V1-c]EFO70953.1 UbiC transcription regulator-associated domain protein [Lactobacillus iners LactinV 01V1-a]EFO71824.1 UbiC transcription regulator-associated domain protein [Lactobacillus iners SPIN 2503V10-D]EEW51394.1 UbiC transcription regulator-associated domain protein [Lactobacillus iners DSM 13335]EFQ48263.1 UbiC transcription reg
MADLVYRTIMHDIKEKIVNKEYDGMRLPDERSLSEHYQVSRSSMKRALELLAQEGIVFKKRGSGTFINPLYLKNRGLFKYEGSNLGITDSFSVPGKSQNIELLDYQVIKTDDDLKQDLFLTSSDFVYKIRRLRLLDDQPFLIETGFIPIKIAPDLNPDILKKSLFNYLEHQKNKRVTKSFLTITVEPSTLEDQVKLMLEPNEPVGIIEGIFFLDDGTPFEVSNMRVHYKYMKYNSFVNLNK